MTSEKQKIYVISGYHYHFDEGEHDIITAVFPTREAAAKYAMEIFQETFPDRADEFTVEGCMYGNNFGEGEILALNIEEFSI